MELSFLKIRQGLEAALEDEKSKVTEENCCDVECRTQNSTFDAPTRAGTGAKAQRKAAGDGGTCRREPTWQTRSNQRLRRSERSYQQRTAIAARAQATV